MRRPVGHRQEINQVNELVVCRLPELLAGKLEPQVVALRL